MERRGFSFRSIILHSLWITLTGSLLFGLAATKGHNFGYVKFFSISGTLLMTLPWLIQLLVTFVVILLHKTKRCNLMWIIQTPKPKENHQKALVSTTTATTTTTSSLPPLSPRQVLKIDNVDEIEIRIVSGRDDQRSPKVESFANKLVEGRSNTKLLTSGTLVAA